MASKHPGMIGAGMAAVIAALALSLLLIGRNSAASQSTSSGHESSCADLLDYGGGQYQGMSLRTRSARTKIGLIPRSHRRAIGAGTRPGCRDTNHQPPAPNERVTVARIDGVSPRIAIADSAGQVYLRSGATLPATLSTQPWIYWITP